MSKKTIASVVLSLVLLVSGTTVAYAHVVVKPSEVGIGQRTNFVVSVPTEENNPTVAVRLVIPEGVASVRPNVKPGWTIQIKKVDELVTEIMWSGGKIPADQRDEFVFSAQAPKSETTLVWKAYQTYSSGLIVAWENDPKVVEEYAAKNTPVPGVTGELDDHGVPMPYSVTKVINDLAKATASPSSEITTQNQAVPSTSSVTNFIAIILSVAAIGMQVMKKK